MTTDQTLDLLFVQTAYANMLLVVLELKHRPRVIPALPGLQAGWEK